MVVVDRDNGCTSASATVTLGVNETAPTATLSGNAIDQSDNTVCDPTLAISTGSDYNGRVTVVPGGTAGPFTYEWFIGQSTATAVIGNIAGASLADPNGDGAGSQLDNVPGGIYTLRLTDGGTGCDDTFEYTVVDNTTDPTIVTAGGDGTDFNLTPVSVCDGGTGYPNGGVQVVNLTGSGDYSFAWYFGGSVDAANILDDSDDIFTQKGTAGTGVNVSGSTTATLSNVDPGMYTVQITDNETGCISAAATFTVVENLTLPTAALSGNAIDQSDNTVCDPTLATSTGSDYNGRVTVVPTGVGPFTYEWFIGQSTATAVIGNIAGASLADPNGDGAGSQLDNVPGGIYTLRLTDGGTGCDDTFEYTVVDNTTDPTIVTAGGDGTDFNLTPVSVCDGGTGYPNGGVQVVNLTGSGDYSFAWYFGGSVDAANILDDSDDIFTQKGTAGTGVNVSGSTTATLSNVDPGMYTVQITDNETGCISAAATFTVVENLTLPTAALSGNAIDQSDNTVCDPTLATSTGSDYNGRVTVVPTGVGPFTYEWFIGQSTATAVIGNIAGASLADPNGDGAGSQLDNVPGGIYTLRLTDGGTGCDDTFEYTVVDNTTDPTIVTAGGDGTDFNLTPVSVCDGGTGYPNGGVQVVNLTGSGDYSFAWYFGGSVDAANILDDSDDIFTQKGTAGTGVNVSGSTTATLSNVDPGMYTVQITDNETGCISAAATFTVVENLTLPTAALSGNAIDQSDNTVCDPTLATSTGSDYNGRVTVVPTGVGPFTYEWFIGQSTATAVIGNIAGASLADPNGDGAGSQLDNVPGGIYTLRLTDGGTGCDDTFEYTVVDNTTDPTIVTAGGDGTDFNLTPVSVCDGGTGYPNGGVQVVNLTGSGDYSFAWYFGGSVDAANILDDSDDIFTQKGTAGTGVNVSGSTTATLSNVDPGMYTVQITDNETGCISAAATFTVVENLTLPTAALSGNAIDQSDNTVCDPTLATSTGSDYNGRVTVVPTGVGPFTYEWFIGQSTATAVIGNIAGASLADPNGDGAGSQLDNVPGGIYTLRLTDGGTGCDDTFEYTVVDNTTDPTIVTAGGDGTDFNLTPVSVCDGGTGYPNGGVQVVNLTGSGDYSFAWYFGGSVDAANILDDSDDIFTQKGTAGTGVNVSGSTTATLSNVDPGMYTVQITDNETGCISAAATFTVVENLTLPTAALSGNAIDQSDNTVCDPTLATSTGSDYNGRVTVVPTGVGPFTYEWFIGQSTATAVIGNIAGASLADPNGDGAGSQLDNVPGGIYTLRLTDGGTGCDDTFEYTVVDNTTDPTIVTAGGDGTDFNLTPVSVCDGGTGYPNGGVQVVNLTGSGDYSFAWYFGGSVDAANILDDSDDIFTQKGTAGTGVNVSGSTTATLSNVDPGMYTVQITDNETGCISAAATFTVVENLTLPTAALSGNAIDQSDNTVCDPTLATSTGSDYNGRVTVVPTGVGPFTYEWFIGQSTATAVIGNIAGASLADPNGDGAGSQLDNVPGGIYTLRLTDGGTGCDDTFEFTVVDNITDPVIDISGGVAVDFNVTPNTACIGANPFPNGAIALLDVTGVGPFVYTWYYGLGVNASNEITDGTNILAQKGTGIGTELGSVTGATSASISNLDAGFYTVVTLDQATGCTSDPVTLEVTDDIPSITITASVVQDDFACDITNPTGQLSAEASTAAGEPSSYTINYYTGGTATGTPFSNNTAVAPSTPIVVSNLAAGTYTVEVINNDTQCSQVQQLEIIRSQPAVVANAAEGSPQTTCVPLDGQVTSTPSISYSNGTPTGITPSYTYEWWIGQTVGAGAADFTTQNVATLEAGFYTVVVTETNSGCSSVAQTVEVRDQVSGNQPTVEFTADVIPTSCNAIGGEISAVITNNPGGNSFTFEWYEGSDDYANLFTTASGNELNNGETLLASPNPAVSVTVTPGVAGSAELDNLVSGLYTLVMIDQTTGCRYQETFDLGFNGIQATTTLAIDHVSQCPDNGQATVGLADQITIDYSSLASGPFEFFETITGQTSGATAFLNFDNTTNQLTASEILGTLQVGETIEGANSGATATIDNISNAGFIASDVDDITQYDIYLYFGNGVPADRFTPYTVSGLTFPVVFDGSTLAPGGEAIFSNLPAGSYTAIAREKSTSFSGDECFSLAAIDEIEDRAHEPLSDGVIITDNTSCITGPGGNGSIQLDVRKDNDDTFQPGTFDFNWYTGTTATGSPILTETDVATSTVSNLDPGQYTVQVDRVGLPETTVSYTGATGSFIEGETINFAGGGSATVSDDDGSTLNVVSETGSLTGLITGAISGVTANTNVVTVGGGDTNNCTFVATYNVQDNPDQYAIDVASATIVPITNCGATGSITLDDATLNGTLLSALGTPRDLTGIAFTWSAVAGTGADVSGATIGTSNGSTSATISGLPAGTYEVFGTITGCVTPTIQIEILDNTTDPVISLSINTIDTSCETTDDIGNGIIDFSIINDDNGTYSYQWYSGTTTTTPVTGTGITGINGNFAIGGPYTASLSGVDGGDYTIEVIDTSDPSNTCGVTATISLTEFNPDITIADANLTIVDQDDCTPANGSATVVLVTETTSVGGTTNVAAANYTIRWYDAATGGTLLNTGAAFTGLTAGTYYVEATRNSTSCVMTNRKEVIIEDETVDPIIQFTSIDLDELCGATTTGDGSITAEVLIDGAIVAATNYTFTWFEGSGTTTPLSTAVTSATTGGTNGQTASGLSDGTYTVQIRDDLNPGIGCNAEATIVLGQFTPDITIADADLTISPQDDCTPANGFATVVLVTETLQAGGTTNVAASNYTIRWYDAATGGNLLNTGASFTGLTAGTYYVEATRNSSSCVMANRKEVIIEDMTVDPIIQFTVVNSDSNCGATTSGNGEIIASVLIDGAPVSVNNYTFTWFEGSGTTTALGTNVTTAGTGGTNGEQASGLSDGTYTVQIEDNLNPGIGCNAEATIVLGQFTPDITIADADLTISPQDDCTPANGSATVVNVTETTEAGGTSVLAASNYTIEWFDAASGGNLLNTGAALNNLTAGTYYVQATRTSTGCGMTIRKEVIVEDQTVAPIIQFTIVNSDSNCGATTSGNGEIIASILIDGAPVSVNNYTINWFEGSGTGTALGTAVATASTGGTNGEQASGLSDGTYTVQIIDALNPGVGCNAEATIVLGQFTPDITIADADLTINAQDDCTPANGSATVVNVTETTEAGGTSVQAASNYTIQWYDAPTGGNLLSTGAALSNLTAGTYYVEATRTSTSCSMAVRKEVVVEDQTVDPIIQFTVNNLDSNCGATTSGNGVITASVLIDGAPVSVNNYTFNWFEGSGTSTALGTGVATATTGGTNGEQASGLSDGTYTVQIIDALNPGIGCNAEATIVLDQFTPDITIADADLTINAQDDCSPVNGSATVVDVTETTEAGGTTTLAASNYTIQWYDAPTGGTLLNTGATLSNLAAGTYYVEATRTSTGCGMSVRKEVIVEDQTVAPIIQFTVNNLDSNCGAVTSGNGMITASVLIDGAPVSVNDYTFNWFEGTGTGTALGTTVGTAVQGGTNGEEVSGLSDGTYTVQIIDALNPGIGCNAEATIVLDQFTPDITIADADLTINAQDDCSPENGSTTVVDVTETTEAGGTTTLAASNYTIQWYDAPTGGTLLNTGATLSNLAAGTYYVEATRTSTGCGMSVRKEVIVEDQTVAPIIQFTVNNLDSNCGAVTSGNGMITASVLIDGAPVSVNDYTFNWFEGTGTGTALGTTVGTAVQGGTNGEEVSGLSDGTYTVQIIDALNPGIGCNAEATIVLDQFTPELSIIDADLTINDQDDCSPANGSATVVNVTETVETGGTASLAASNYTIRWYDAATAGNLLTTGATLSNLSAGTYYVEATRNSTSCAMTTRREVVIEDISVNPVVVFTLTQEDSSCDTGNNGTGVLEVGVEETPGGTPVTSGYQFEWFRGLNNTTTPLDGSGSASVATGNLSASGLSDDFYTVRVTDLSNPNSNCQTIASFEVTENTDVITITVDTDVTIVENTNCSDAFNPFTGSIQIDNVRENGIQVAVTDYSFTWASAGGGALPAGASTSSVNGTNDLLENLPAGTYEVIATNTSTSCVNATPVQIVVEETLTSPTVEIVTTPNTICDPLLAAFPNGSLTATAQFQGNDFAGTGRFAFEWFDGNSVGAAALGAGTVGSADNIAVLSNEESGFYTVRVTDQVTGCTVVSTVSVDDVLETPILDNPEARVTGSSICTGGVGNGSIVLTDADITGNDLTLYDLEWIRGVVTNAPFDTQTNPVAAGFGSQTNLEADTYFVIATNRTTGCAAAPAVFVVQDISFDPVLSFSQQPNIGCGAETPNGSLTALADGVDHTDADYDFQWYTGVGAVVGNEVLVGSGGQTNMITGQSQGFFTLEVMRISTGCSVVQTFELENEQFFPEVVPNTSVVTDQTECTPNGSAEVTEVTYNGTTFNTSADLNTNFTFAWFDNVGLTSSVGSDDPLLSNLAAGSYWVVITHTATGCIAQQAVQFDVEDDIDLPLVIISQVMADESCNGVTGTGSLSATADGQDDTNPNYTFQWFDNTNTALTAAANNGTSSTAINLVAGQYRVDVTNTATGCMSSETFIVTSEPFEPFITDINVTASTTCSPGNGTAEITGVSSGAVADYTFFWFETAAQVTAFTPVQSGVTSLTGLEEGDYFVIAEHIATGCRSVLPQQVDVLDSAVAPVITQTNVLVQTNCNPAIPNGAMTVAADGVSSTSLFTYTWRDENGIVIEANNPTITDIAAGDYTVEVTSLTSGCTNSRTFRMVDDNSTPVLRTSVSPNTYCVNPSFGVMPNGQAAASVISNDLSGGSVNQPTYDFYWFRGSTIPSDFSNFTSDPNFIEVAQLLDTIGAGTYTVVAVNQADNFCVSQPETIVVGDESDNPVVELVQDLPLTNCDPLRPNGEASVSTPNASIANFIIEWYAGADTTGIQPFQSGFGQIVADSLSAITYTVVLTDVVQGCQTLTQITIEDATEPVPLPVVENIESRINCVVPNGSAAVDIDGELRDFTFRWFAEADLDNPLSTGTSIAGLDGGNYFVQAESNLTGCVSELVPFTILDESGPVPFIVETTPSVCSLDNGTATLRFDNPIEIDSIVWDLGDGDIRFDNTLINATDGTGYTVFVRDRNQCESSATFNITTDIIVYNGVSDNSDGFNDSFIIDCIDRFEFNRVTIFNRAGQRVWEVDGYINDDPVSSFNGFANSGLSLGSDRLPEGTYYYIIDRNRLTDNDDLLQGFLELVR